MATTLRMAIDLGNSQVKIHLPEQDSVIKAQTIVYPAALMPAEAVPNDVVNINNKNAPFTETFQLTNDSQQFIWGESLTHFLQNDQIRNSISKTNRYTMPEYQKLAKFAMAEGVKRAGLDDDGKVKIDLSIGLPDSDYEALQKDDYKELKDIYVGTQSVEVDGETIQFTVNKSILVIQQGIGTALSMLIDDEGYYQNEELENQRVLIVDVGGGTTILTTLDSFKPNLKLSKTLWTGANSIYRDIINQVLENQGIELDINQLEKNIKNGELTYKAGRKTIDFSNEYKNATSSAILRLRNNIQTTISDTDSVEKMIFTGGGINLFAKEDLINMFGFGEIAPNAEFANVIGFSRAQLLGNN